jgi:hypothetical protein
MIRRPFALVGAVAGLDLLYRLLPRPKVRGWL